MLTPTPLTYDELSLPPQNPIFEEYLKMPVEGRVSDLEKAAQAALDAGDFSAFLMLKEDVLAQREALFGSFHPAFVVHLHELVVLYIQHALHCLSQSAEAALSHLQRAQSLVEQLYPQLPVSKRLRHLTQSTLAMVYLTVGNYPAALQCTTAAMDEHDSPPPLPLIYTAPTRIRQALALHYLRRRVECLQVLNALIGELELELTADSTPSMATPHLPESPETQEDWAAVADAALVSFPIPKPTVGAMLVVALHNGALEEVMGHKLDRARVYAQTASQRAADFLLPGHPYCRSLHQILFYLDMTDGSLSPPGGTTRSPPSSSAGATRLSSSAVLQPDWAPPTTRRGRRKLVNATASALAWAAALPMANVHQPQPPIQRGGGGVGEAEAVEAEAVADLPPPRPQLVFHSLSSSLAFDRQSIGVLRGPRRRRHHSSTRGGGDSDLDSQSRTSAPGLPQFPPPTRSVSLAYPGTTRNERIAIMTKAYMSNIRLPPRHQSPPSTSTATTSTAAGTGGGATTTTTTDPLHNPIRASVTINSNTTSSRLVYNSNQGWSALDELNHWSKRAAEEHQGPLPPVPPPPRTRPRSGLRPSTSQVVERPRLAMPPQIPLPDRGATSTPRAYRTPRYSLGSETPISGLTRVAQNLDPAPSRRPPPRRKRRTPPRPPGAGLDQLPPSSMSMSMPGLPLERPRTTSGLASGSQRVQHLWATSPLSPFRPATSMDPTVELPVMVSIPRPPTTAAPGHRRPSRFQQPPSPPSVALPRTAVILPPAAPAAQGSIGRLAGAGSISPPMPRPALAPARVESAITRLPARHHHHFHTSPPPPSASAAVPPASSSSPAPPRERSPTRHAMPIPPVRIPPVAASPEDRPADQQPKTDADKAKPSDDAAAGGGKEDEDEEDAASDHYSSFFEEDLEEPQPNTPGDSPVRPEKGSSATAPAPTPAAPTPAAPTPAAPTAPAPAAPSPSPSPPPSTGPSAPPAPAVPTPPPSSAAPPAPAATAAPAAPVIQPATAKALSAVKQPAAPSPSASSIGVPSSATPSTTASRAPGAPPPRRPAPPGPAEEDFNLDEDEDELDDPFLNRPTTSASFTRPLPLPQAPRPSTAPTGPLEYEDDPLAGLDLEGDEEDTKSPQRKKPTAMAPPPPGRPKAAASGTTTTSTTTSSGGGGSSVVGSFRQLGSAHLIDVPDPPSHSGLLYPFGGLLGALVFPGILTPAGTRPRMHPKIEVRWCRVWGALFRVCLVFSQFAMGCAASSNNVVVSPLGPTVPERPLHLIISGAPASGKGTQCERIVAKYYVVHVSTGDLLREQGTPLGLQAKPIMESGGLVPDELVINLLKDRISQPDCEQGVPLNFLGGCSPQPSFPPFCRYLLDGFPRTEAQALFLKKEGFIQR
ncbi:putative Adenylate kinase [Paratrimastix pyriformis]|uniref:Adenylate kinase n=1 Tax=Paratrimastix pyriformis TaxID=342808 RepID=A0ABQ8UI46_9EUKA|nr:putative Adenylate kinase [Paratrimastix pyriformis]